MRGPLEIRETVHTAATPAQLEHAEQQAAAIRARWPYTFRPRTRADRDRWAAHDFEQTEAVIEQEKERHA